MRIARMHWIAAAWCAVAYIAIQTFQWYAFSVMPPEGSAEASLLDGASPMNLARAISMLVAFFALAYLFLITCATNVRRAPVASVAAFLGLFVFCLLELVLRSIELFWVYLALPAQYAAADAAGQAHVLSLQQTFYAVQGAVYFPLGLVQSIASVILAIHLRGPWSAWARAAFAINALRLGLRMFDAYVLGPKFDALYDVLYLPLVYVIFGGIAGWLFKGREAA